jgi:hypothetical protein
VELPGRSGLEVELGERHLDRAQGEADRLVEPKKNSRDSTIFCVLFYHLVMTNQQFAMEAITMLLRTVTPFLI